MKNQHKTVTIKIDGEPCKIDCGVAELIKTMNSIPGISTMSCCEGGNPDGFEFGYVQFLSSGDRPEPHHPELRFSSV